jgi:hypothetical protein
MPSIEEEIQQLGPLENVAAAIVDYVTAGARCTASSFCRYGYEWTLEPDNWINLKFSCTRRGCYRIHASLGVSPTRLGPVLGLEIKKGRWQNWSRITISNVMQLPAAFRCIEKAYYESKNKYRNKHGKPQPAAEA